MFPVDLLFMVGKDVCSISACLLCIFIPVIYCIYWKYSIAATIVFDFKFGPRTASQWNYFLKKHLGFDFRFFASLLKGVLYIKSWKSGRPESNFVVVVFWCWRNYILLGTWIVITIQNWRAISNLSANEERFWPSLVTPSLVARF